MTAVPEGADPRMEDDDLGRLRMALGRLGRVLRQQTDDSLSYPLISLLFCIVRTQPVSAGDLAAAEGVSPPSVTRSLDRLTDGDIGRLLAALPALERLCDPALSPENRPEHRPLLSRVPPTPDPLQRDEKPLD